MQFERKNWWQLTYFEVTRPMFLFVVFCVLQYAFTDYLEFGLCILAFTILALLFTVREKLLSQEEMESMLTKERTYQVLSNERIIQTSSRGVVPGDIVFFKDGNVPFDGVLVEGAVLIDEASLTGESFPVSKKELNLQEYRQTKKIPGESLLFEGTRIVQCRSSSIRGGRNLGVAMLVTLTSSSSYKGQIMRTIKFPKNSFLEFER
jgi:cation-transporting ATPase 13A2